jgi:hypothetical protein
MSVTTWSTSRSTDAAILGLYHGHQEQAWTKNVLDGVEAVLAEAGVHSRLGVVPAICILDITGYTMLTEEQGDEAAAELAEAVGTSLSPWEWCWCQLHARLPIPIPLLEPLRAPTRLCPEVPR